MNPRITLRAIRDQRPCEEGWKTLLISLGGASVSLDTEVSLGDIARSNGSADAWWCVCVLDWADIAVRRAVIAALMPAVRRAARHTDDRRVHDCIAALDRWLEGDDSVDLIAAADAARAAADAAEAAWVAAEVTRVAVVAAWVAAEATRAAAEATRAMRAARVAADAAEAAWAAVVAAARAAARAAEQEAQRTDLIAAFPPLHAERSS